MLLLDLLQADGLQFKKVASTNGGEYAGPCPSCGGADRFRCWPEQGDGGRFWCRGCDKKGDAIQYLRDFRGHGYLEACSLLGQEPKESKRSLDWDRKPGNHHQSALWQPRETAQPGNLWQSKAISFLKWSEAQLWSETDTSARDWLHGRGLTDETIKVFRLGWNPQDWFIKQRTAWGLHETLNDKGKPKKLWLPLGLVIPKLTEDSIVRLRFRRPDGDPRYYLLPGSETGALCIPGGPACVVVESELDATLLHQDAGDLATMIALGSAQARPDHAAAALLDQAETILVSLDSDEAGAKAAWQWWAQHYPKAKRWPVIRGKDPTEARQNGLDLRAWILAGLPAQEPVELPAAQAEPAIMAALGNPYPNEGGQVACDCCLSWKGKSCVHGHQPDGISLLRECDGFSFNRDAYDDFY
jgi:DNA primase